MLTKEIQRGIIFVDKYSTKENNTEEYHMKNKQKKSLNYKNCYILFISCVAIISLFGNVFQNHIFTSAILKQEELISSYEDDGYFMIAETFDDNKELQLNN